MYQVLYRKYRPQTFDDVVGQAGVTQTLKRQLTTGKLSHAYLFTGSRGTGKTSCAKILAKAVNCERPENGNPCNECAACRAIDAGACLDVLEIDAASNNGVDQVRALRDDAIYSPAEVRMRVYIVDEVHMLSTAAFNALLKIIEEPPAHLMFILATTELHKVPATILSRCQRFSFRRLTPGDIAGRMEDIARREQIDIEPDAVHLLSRLADGALRDGLSLLDQCASAVEGTITTESIAQTLGLAGTRQTAQMLQAIAAHDAAGALAQFDALYAAGKDTAAMLDELCALSRDLLVLKTAPKSGIYMLTGISSDAELQSLEKLFSAGELLRITDLLQKTMAGFSKSLNLRTDAELCLLQLCNPALQLDAAALGARLSRLEEAVAGGKVAISAAPPAPPTAATPPRSNAEDTPPWDDVPPPHTADDAPPWDDEISSQAPPAPSVPPAPKDAPIGFWTDLTAKVRQQMGPQANMYLASLTGELQADTLQITTQSPILLQQLQRIHMDRTFQDAATAMLGRPISVKLSLPTERKTADGSFDDLVAFGQKHSEIFDIK